MTDDSTQIAATSHAQRRAHGTTRETVAEFVFRHGRSPVAQKVAAALRPERKFSALQGLEMSQNAERISIWGDSCVALSEEAAVEPIVDHSNQGVAAVQIAAREADGSPANGAATP